jgi:hypothetical protein
VTCAGAIAIAGVLVAAPAARAADWIPPYMVGGQSTVVWQHLPSFRSPYVGPRSFRPGPEDAVSHSYTLYTGVRLLPWLDVYVDPEMIRGEGVGGGFGLAGYTNGEVVRNPAAGMDPYLARAFLRATIPFGGDVEDTDADTLHVGGARPRQRLVLTGGVLAAADIFDTNRYANSTRTQFLNWSFINDTAWDFAADTRGYTRGGAVEWIEDDWAVRLGSFQMPTVANGLDLDGDLLEAHGDELEVEAHPPVLAGRETVVRMMAYANHARMGDYRDALALAARTGGTPDVTRTRRTGRVKYGFTLNVEQPLTEDGSTGLFARGGWNDGRHESFAYTEVDDTFEVGGDLRGAWWRRPFDKIGLAFVTNGISDVHREYLRLGGHGFLLGDACAFTTATCVQRPGGYLNYGRENIVELYYNAHIWRGAFAAADVQLVDNPGYNQDRGPAWVFSLRGHLEF